MFFLATLVFGVLALGPQVVLSYNFTLELSEVKQCEPVSIKFLGLSDSQPIPMRVTLVPFNSKPISLPIPNAASSISGVYVTFIPFASGTNFVASLDNEAGESLAQVSDIIRVLPSPTGNTTCLPVTGAAISTRFTLENSTFSQCENFTIKYNSTIVTRVPSVRFYNPKGPSRSLNLTFEDYDAGLASYLLSFKRSKEIVLVIDDGSNDTESSALMTVGGDSSSSDRCLISTNNAISMPQPSKPPPPISLSVIIGGSVGGGVVVLLALGMLLFILRERRIKREVNVRFNPVLMEKGHPSTPYGTIPSPTPLGTERRGSLSSMTRDPPYTAERFLSPTTPYYPRASVASWSQPTFDDQRLPFGDGDVVYEVQRDEDGNRLSLNSLDIESMLNLATVQSNRSSRLTSEPTPLGPSLHSLEPVAHKPSLVVPDRYSSWGHFGDPPDASKGHPSMSSALTMTSVLDPFQDSILKQSTSSDDRKSSDLPIRLPPKVAISLPSSPRDGLNAGSSNSGRKVSV